MELPKYKLMLWELASEYTPPSCSGTGERHQTLHLNYHSVSPVDRCDDEGADSKPWSRPSA